MSTSQPTAMTPTNTNQDQVAPNAEAHPETAPGTAPEPVRQPLSKKGDDIFATDATFEAMGLRSSVLKGIHELGFERPTTIQATLIPKILGGKDVLGQAKTGTGKTA